MSNVMVVGLGYVGLPLAIRAAEVGHHVTGIDLDPRRVNDLDAGTSYVEDVSDERVRSAIASGRFSARVGSRELGPDSPPDPTFDIALIAVPTPLRSNVPDLDYVKSAARMIGRSLQEGGAVVLESTTYPGTAEGVLADVLTETSGLRPGVDFHLGFSPERIDPGNEHHTLRNTPKLVSATTPGGLQVIDEFYRSIVDCTVPVSSPRVAEMAKVFENTQAYVNIALVNELAEICHDLEIDVHEMIEAAMTKGHSVARWTPGPGVGGHCLPIDPMYLAWQTRAWLGRPFRLAEVANQINLGRPHYVVDRAVALLRERHIPIHGAEVLVLGLAYKPGVSDMRESPAVEIVHSLMDHGAVVTVVDPHVDAWETTSVLGMEDIAGAIDRFDIAIVTTDHAEFDYEKIATEARLVLDCRHAMPSSHNVVSL